MFQINFKTKEMRKYLVRMFTEKMIYQFPYYPNRQVTNSDGQTLNYSKDLVFVLLANLYTNCDILQLEKNHVQFYKNENENFYTKPSTTIMDLINVETLNTPILHKKNLEWT